MMPYSDKSTRFTVVVTVVVVFLGVLVSFFMRPTAGDYIDKHTVGLMRDHLDQWDICKEEVINNVISSDELETLRDLKKYYVSIYSNITEVEQDLACKSEEISKMLYFGWLLKGSKRKYEEKVMLENINIAFAQRSISLSVSNSKHVPPEALEVLDKIEYFKKPSRLDSSLLENY